MGKAIGSATALQEEKKRAEMLAELDRSKTIFFSNVSHEFRYITPSLPPTHINTTYAYIRSYTYMFRNLQQTPYSSLFPSLFLSFHPRTPLTLIMGPLEDSLADTLCPLPPAHRERLTIVQRNGMRLLRLVNTILDFSRIEAGRMQVGLFPLSRFHLSTSSQSFFKSHFYNLGQIRSHRPTRVHRGPSERVPSSV